MTKMKLPAETHEAGNYIHKNVCFNLGAGIVSCRFRGQYPIVRQKIELPAE